MAGQKERSCPRGAMTAKRKRPVHLHVMASEEELAQIRKRMEEAGIQNMGAYIRKMALNGYVLNIDLAPVRELVSFAAPVLQQSQIR